MLALKIIGGFSVFFGLLGLLAAYLFRIQHWPGATVCFMAGAFLLVTGVIALAAGFIKK
jgi:hypothetical protein